MKANIRVGALTLVSVSSLNLYPSNPRRGDIEAIASSLEAHGQYRPIVVQKSTNFILAGNHTYKAMKKLGHKKIKVTFIDCDDAQARKIVLADNRTTDLAGYDEPLLKSLLSALPDLTGTGFTSDEVELLDRINNKGVTDTDQKSTTLPSDPEVKIGIWQFTVDSDVYGAWRDELHVDAPTKSKANRAIKERLGFPERVPVVPESIPHEISEVGDDVEIVPIGDVKAHNLNPREGDIGAIIEGLSTLGQYRPIVVNRRTGKCVSGNHTLASAFQLGWESIAVHYIDVDDEEELKILIVDNRTSDLATYDTGELKGLLTLGNLKGTGFNADDAREILAGGKSKPSYMPVGRTNIRVGEHVMRVHTDDLREWSNTIYGVNDIAELLGIPTEAIQTEVE